MRKKSITPYVILALFLIGILSFPKIISDHMRFCAISVPSSAKKKIHHPINSEYEKLKAENKRLKEHLDGISDWLLFDQRLEKQLDRLHDLSQKKEDTPYWNDFLERRKQELSNLLKAQIESWPANIIYRDPISWSSSFWVDMGQNDNEKLGKVIIAKNSPVISNGCIIGVVEQVYKDKSRVRLITDSGLICSVRAVRGKRQNLRLYEKLDLLSDDLSYNDELFVTDGEKQQLLEVFAKLKNRLFSTKEDSYLAKGEIRGCSAPIFRSKSSLLKGIGFNYDFSDEEGLCKDLLSGRDITQKEGFIRPLIKKGDLLITTGFDGVFPPGLDVAIASKVFPLKDFSYELEAKPAVGNLDSLKVVFILPPICLE